MNEAASDLAKGSRVPTIKPVCTTKNERLSGSFQCYPVRVCIRLTITKARKSTRCFVNGVDASE